MRRPRVPPAHTEKLSELETFFDKVVLREIGRDPNRLEALTGLSFGWREGRGQDAGKWV